MTLIGQIAVTFELVLTYNDVQQTVMNSITTSFFIYFLFFQEYLSLFREYHIIVMSERDEETAFIPPQPLVPDSENNRRYILQISDNEEGEEDRIEKMY